MPSENVFHVADSPGFQSTITHRLSTLGAELEIVMIGILYTFLICGLMTLSASAKPNIIVILCDDLGYGDLACYGHPHIQTPTLDQMAKEGIRFTDFYSTAPVCSPSRVGLLTGRSPNRAGVYDWIPPGNKPRADAREQVHMRANEVTIPALLKQAGYATCMAGKWHCNAMFNSPKQAQPNDAGFDHWFGTQNNASPSHENPNNFIRNGEAVGPMKGFSCLLVADEARSWMTSQVKEHPDQPFFIYVAFHEPHEPIASPEELVEKYLTFPIETSLPVAKTRKEAEYFANVENVDHAVARILAAVKAVGKDQETLVIFTSDNGPETLNRYGGASRSYGRPDPLRGMKLWTTDAGFRVAGIMRWPGTIKAGQVSETPVSALDFLPSFCQLAGATVPAELHLDGTSMLPALHDAMIDRKQPLFWAYYNAINERRVAMRDGEWKVLARLEGLPKLQNVHQGNVDQVRKAKLTDIEIYRVSEDIGEGTNLAARHPEKAAELGKKLEGLYRELVGSAQVWTAVAP
ncbi:MAG: arylsulfatase A [Verrucomicrobiales bacterium]